MPATTLRIDDAVTHAIFRQWDASSVQDVAAGNSLSITINQTTGGATPPNQPQTLTLRAVTDAGTDVRSFTLDPALTTQTVSFFFSHDGTAVGTPRCGTAELVLHAIRTGSGSYDVESDGAPNTPPTGFHTHTATRGWARGTTTLIEDVISTAADWTTGEPAAYDDSLKVTTTSGAVSYVARALTVATSAGSLSSATNSTTAVTRDVTFANVCDDRFPAASTTVGVTVTVPNATVSGLPDWTYTSTTEDTIEVDPRLTLTFHVQLNDPVFSTTKPSATELNGPSELGHTWVRAVNSRGVGVNGLSASVRFTDPFSVNTTGFARTTTTMDGQAGWTNNVATFSESKPSGNWQMSLDVTSPTDIETDDYLVGSPTPLTVLASNVDLRLFSSIGPLTSAAQDHWKPGDPLLIGAAMFDTRDRDLLAPNTTSGKEPAVAIGRFAADGTVEYLDSDLVTWVDLPLDGTGSTDRILLTRADLFDGNGDTTPDLPGADPRVWLLLLTNTTAFAYTTVFMLVLFHDSNGNRYAEHVSLDPLGAANPHSANQFDPTGLFK